MDSSWASSSLGITMPKGFLATGIRAGLKASGKPDLALLLAPEDAICSGTFTRSVSRAACVDLSAARLQERAGKVRAVLINSGQANACTGDLGLIDSQRATEALADRLGLLSEEVLICSTGIIGEPIDMQNLLKSIDPLVVSLSRQGGDAAATAILTTDLVEKQVSLEADLGGRRVCIGGMAKGSGMIHPEMATMLAFLTCDVGVSFDKWEAMVKRVVANSFNAITVDGDTSTNDSFLAFAAGDPLEDAYLDDLEVGLRKATQHLAKAIARDGEGATCLLEIKVIGTSSDNEAQQIARTICSSSLVKTAVHGHDPNWGRIIAAAGRAGIPFCLESVELLLGPYKLMAAGKPLKFDREAASNYIKKCKISDKFFNNKVDFCLKVGDGSGLGIAWGCDLSDQYIRINADYTT